MHSDIIKKINYLCIDTECIKNMVTSKVSNYDNNAIGQSVWINDIGQVFTIRQAILGEYDELLIDKFENLNDLRNDNMINTISVGPRHIGEYETASMIELYLSGHPVWLVTLVDNN